MDDFDLTDELRINAGVRFTSFAHVGPFTEYILDENGRQHRDQAVRAVERRSPATQRSNRASPCATV